ncbi:MAG: ABC transporter permease [Gemmatimonadales bacterium]|nr:ABC transporter permease [Gemmatimonadales bacterium]
MGFRRLFRLTGREPMPTEDIAMEFEAHLQMKADALVRSGFSAELARKEAERRFGPLERFARECRDIDVAERRERRRREWWSGALRDLRQAARALMRAPGFTLTAMLVLAAGIGLNATVFGVLRGVVLQPLPYPGSDRLVAIHSSSPERGWPIFTVSAPDFLDWERDARTIGSLFAYRSSSVAPTGTRPASQITLQEVSSRFHATMGVEPAVGRSFTSPDFERGAAPVTLLSHDTWVTRFGGDASVLGRRWILDGVPYEIIGVMPRGFAFPVSPADAWTPFIMPADAATQRSVHYLTVVGRLADGASVEGSATEFATIAARLAKEYPTTNANLTTLVRLLHEEVVGEIRPTVLLLLTGTALLLILATANVANLVLVRSMGRSGEAALRSALGASRGRLLWYGASEVILLVILGALAAIPVAAAGMGLVRRYGPNGVPRLDQIRLDPLSLLFTLGVTALAMTVVSLAPARRAAGTDIRSTLGAGTRAVGTRRGLHRWLVAIETTVALALLAVAGVLVKSKARLESVDPGFDARSTLVADLSLPDKQYSTPEAVAQFQSELLRRLQDLPGVEAAALIFGLPLTGLTFSSSFTIDSVAVADAVNQSAQLRAVSADYFAAQRIPVLAGRGFTKEDRRGGRPVLVVSAGAAKRYWPNGSPLGHAVRMSARAGPDRAAGEIVGIVGDVREEGLNLEPRPIVYAVNDQVAIGYFTVVLRTATPPASLTMSLRRTVADLDPELPLGEVRTMEEVVSRATATPRFRAWLMGFFALLAAALAGLGVYGVISHIVAQRTREIGLRRALGATDGQVVGEVIRSGMRDAVIGAAAGLILGWGITQQLSGLLYQVEPGDPAVLGASAAVFLGVAFLACWIPARRATLTDPALVLRGE